MSGTVVMHPMDAERAREVAHLLGARVALSENWPGDKMGLRGVALTLEQLEKIAEMVPGWRVLRLDEVDESRGAGETPQ